jgi:hypothetical protein
VNVRCEMRVLGAGLCNSCDDVRLVRVSSNACTWLCVDCRAPNEAPSEVDSLRAENAALRAKLDAVREYAATGEQGSWRAAVLAILNGGE